MAEKKVLTLVLVNIIIILAVLSLQMANAQPPTTEPEPGNQDVAPPDPDGGQITTEKPTAQPPPPSDVGAVGGAPASDGADIRDSVHNPDQNALSRRRRQESRQQFLSDSTAASQGNGGTADASADTGMPESSPPDPVTAVTANSGNTAPPVSPVTPDLGTTGSYPQAESMEGVIQGSGDAAICPSGASADTGMPESSLPVPVTAVTANSGNTTPPVSPVTPDLGTTGSYPQAETMEGVTHGSGDAAICPSGTTADTGMPESSLPVPVTAVTANSGNTTPPVSPVTPDLGTTGSCLQPGSMEESGDINVHGPDPANLLNHILMSCGAWLQPPQAHYNQDIDLGRERQLRERRLQERRLREAMATFWNWVSQIAIAYYYFGATDSSTTRHGSAVFMFHRMLAIITLLHLLSFFRYFSSK